MNSYSSLIIGIGLLFLNGSSNTEGFDIQFSNTIFKEKPFLRKVDSLASERIVFYNCENLFHPSNDSTTNDEDFTPGGYYHWTYKRYYNKINKIGKLIIAIGEGRFPAIVGLCEVENRRVLQDLIQKSILSRSNYKIIHKDSPDARGIDVALIYDKESFLPVKYTYVPVNARGMEDLRTREILYVNGYLMDSIIIHIFVNHWPSRRGGKLASDEKRKHVAGILRELVDSCYLHDPEANILIMGDFNDEPLDNSLYEVLGAKEPDNYSGYPYLLNLMINSLKSGDGTHYRKNNFYEASVLDQFIVSNSLYQGFNRLKINTENGFIYKKDFLLDEKNGRPLRTYQGLKYLGGFSDHLPIYTDIQIVN